MDMPLMAGHNVTDSDFVISVRGKQFVLARDAELVVGIGDHQFMLSFDYDAQTVYLTDPKTGERLNLQVKDAIVDGTSISQKLDVVDKIKEIVDVSTVGLTLVDATSRITTVEEFRLYRDNLYGNSNIYEITGLEKGDLIYRMDLQILTAFKTNPDVQHSIGIYGENSEVLMPESWSDPNIENCYTTSLKYTVGSQGKLYVRHDLRAMTQGIAALKVYCAKPVRTGG